MKIIDQVSSQLESLGREVKALPTALDAIQACKDAGVQVPSDCRFPDIYALDAALNRAFSPDGAPLDRPKMEARVRIKNQILAAGMVVESERPVDEHAVRYFANLMRQHKLTFDPTYMLTIPQLNSIMASANLDPGTRIQIKVAAERAGVLDITGTRRPDLLPNVPSTKLVRSVFAQIGVERPTAMSVVAVDRALRDHGISGRRALEIKSVINAAGMLVP
jgi:hypothetical protein